VGGEEKAWNRFGTKMGGGGASNGGIRSHRVGAEERRAMGSKVTPWVPVANVGVCFRIGSNGGGGR